MADAWIFDVLPCRPAPYPDECLSSYLLRLAAANGDVPAWDLVGDLFPGWTVPHQVRLLRWEYPVDGWGRLPLRAQRPPAALVRLTVAPWVAKFRALPAVTRPGYAGPGAVLRGVVEPALRVCPRCVQARPYVRLLWRLAPVAACLEHGCLLQGHCPGCGEPLSAIAPGQRLLRCARCGADVRDVPVVAAPAALLVRQWHQQAGLRFLLDPAVTLVPPPSLGDAAPPPDLPRAIGLKFRYLRTEAGRSIAQLAERVGASTTMIASLEQGRRGAGLPLYLAYLDALSLSWPDFAAVEVPPAFVRRLQEPPHLAARLCPTPGCPNSEPPPGTGVWLLADLPERRIVRLGCRACGRAFTRSYEGALVTKPRRPPLRPGDQPRVLKTPAETARLTAWGLQGLTNRRIARRLGWGERTVRMYWIALGLEGRVHAAQAQRRAQTAQRRQEALRVRIDAVLASLRAADEEITVRRVALALGHNADYLRTRPALAAYVQAAAHGHNAHRRQRRDEALAARIAAALDQPKRRAQPLTLYRLLRQIGLSDQRLRAGYPDLHARMHRALEADRAARQIARRQQHVLRINAAAARLIEARVRLTYTGLLQAAGVDRYYGFRDPIIHDLLEHWIGDSPPRD
jgi:DNA-binding CsgD family transcriptional regulator